MNYISELSNHQEDGHKNFRGQINLKFVDFYVDQVADSISQFVLKPKL